MRKLSGIILPMLMALVGITPASAEFTLPDLEPMTRDVPGQYFCAVEHVAGIQFGDKEKIDRCFLGK